MSELEDRLNSLLSSPEDMGRIAQMASRLMGEIAPEAPAGGAAPPGGDAAGMAGMLGRILQGANDRGKQQLLTGLSPYLAQKRQARLGKALRIAAAARLAGAAFSEMGGDDGL